MEFKKGTTTVGIICKDGVVLGADKRATAGNLIVDKRVRKVYKITDKCALTMAGSVSEAQLLLKLIKAEIRLKRIRTEQDPSIKEIANLLGGMVYGTIRRMFPGVAHFLIAGTDNDGYHLYDIFPDGSVTEIEDFVSSGSGSVFAYGVLETHFKPEMSVADGVKLISKAITTAIQRDSCSGNGLDIVRIKSSGVEWAVTERFETRSIE